ncbi:MAG TPA: GNAT family N-acetyltransferase [Gemmatimonadaceae bacterium]|nr:GNAT family N-acetyltransferase [Gemmatimonadaceae bacterium]
MIQHHVRTLPAKHEEVSIRAARRSDAEAIVILVNGYAAEGIMLPRTIDSVANAIDDFMVAVDRGGNLLGCGALKEYSPSLAEVSSLAIERAAHGTGLGKRIVREVEGLARKRGIDELFALTLTPAFFESAGYAVADRAGYPEKIRRDCLRCPRRIRCDEVCVSRSLVEARALEVAA